MNNTRSGGADSYRGRRTNRKGTPMKKRLLLVAALFAAHATPAQPTTLHPWWGIHHRDAEEGGNYCVRLQASPLDWVNSRNSYNDRWNLPLAQLTDKDAEEVDVTGIPPDPRYPPIERFFRSEAACQAALPTESTPSQAGRDALLKAVEALEDKYR